MREQQIQRRAGGEGVEVAHYAVLPEERARVAVRIERRADHLASIVDRLAAGHHVTGQRSQVPHAGPFGPQEGVSPVEGRTLWGQGRKANRLALIVDR